jgi:endonuclease/exonuclease/phosphatase (EEP) superfamily protein YafD
VTLNCASSAAAAREVAAFDPDIVLFQESPSRDDLEVVATEIFGAGDHVAWGVDASILARGEVTPVEVPAEHRENFVHAQVPWNGRTLDVISLRLYPCPVRIDLWSPRCWEVYRDNREKRRRELGAIASYLATLPESAIVVVGGDFNAPPGDAVFRYLSPRMQDAFPIAGRGWGGTITNDAPAIRIDQVWNSPQLLPLAAFARRTVHSDHRLVVVDLEPGDE